MIMNSWDPKAGLFWAKRDGSPILVRTPFSLFPLMTGRLPAEMTGPPGCASDRSKNVLDALPGAHRGCG